MRTRRLFATDYDGTLASAGRVPETVSSSLEALRRKGFLLALVTGRRLPELHDIFPQLELFHRVVAENGALLYRPEDGTEQLLAPPPPADFVERLRQEGVADLSEGRVVVGSRRPSETIIGDVIRQMTLESQVIFNREAVMVMPKGVNKGTGLQRALDELTVAWSEVTGIGDAENDLDFLEKCGLSFAVANALPALQDRVHSVTAGVEGAGVVEVVEQLLSQE